MPVAAYPVTGPLDVIGRAPVGVLVEDLQAAAFRALKVSRDACLAFALIWEESTRRFLANIVVAAEGEAGCVTSAVQHPSFAA